MVQSQRGQKLFKSKTSLVAPSQGEYCNLVASSSLRSAEEGETRFREGGEKELVKVVRWGGMDSSSTGLDIVRVRQEEALEEKDKPPNCPRRKGDWMVTRRMDGDERTNDFEFLFF